LKENTSPPETAGLFLCTGALSYWGQSLEEGAGEEKVGFADFAKALFQCETFPGVDHGVGPGTGTAAEGWLNRAVDFWRK